MKDPSTNLSRSKITVIVATLMVLILVIYILVMNSTYNKYQMSNLLNAGTLSSGYKIPNCICDDYLDGAIQEPKQVLYCQETTASGQNVCYPYRNPCAPYEVSKIPCVGEYKEISKEKEVKEIDQSEKSSLRKHSTPTGESKKDLIMGYEICENDIVKSMESGLKEKIIRRMEWGMNEDRFIEITEEFKTNPLSYSQDFEKVVKEEQPWRRYPYIGPVTAKCKNIQVFGRDDEEKRFCWHDGIHMEDNKCIVYSVGSNNIYGFETDIVRRTKCKIHIFDCTVATPTMPPEVAARSTFHKVCLAYESFVDDKGRQYMSYRDLVKLAGAKPTLLKMDIEGYEYGVLRSMLKEGFNGMKESAISLLPDQIAMEFHYNSPHGLITAPSFYALVESMFYKGGYILVERNDNVRCNHCSEVLMVRVMCHRTE